MYFMSKSLTIQFAIITDLLRSLEAEGIRLGVDEHTRLQQLLERLPDDISLEGLKQVVTTLIASNPSEQELVYQLFDRSASRVLPLFEKTEVEVIPAESKGLYLAIVLVSLALLGLAGLLWLPRNEQPTIASYVKRFEVFQDSVKQICLTSEELTGLEGGIERAYFVQNQSGRFASLFGEYEFTSDSCITFEAEEFVGTDSVATYFVFSSNDSMLVHFIPSVIQKVETVQAGEAKDDLGTLSKYLFSYKQQTSSLGLQQLAIPPPTRWQTFYEGNAVLLKLAIVLLLGLLLFLLILLRSKNRRKLVAQIESSHSPPHIFRIETGSTLEIETDAQLSALLKAMRLRTVSGAQDIHIPSTIKATIQKGGMIDFRYSSSTQTPEYLLLINKQDADDHQAELFNQLYQYIIENEVYIERFYFKNDLRSCWNEKYPNGIKLDYLHQLYPGTNLVIVGNCYQLLSPLTGRIGEWTKIFGQWKNRVILTDTPTQEWGRREEEIQKQFGLVPGTVEGFTFAIDQMANSVNPNYRSWPKAVNDSSSLPISLEGNTIDELGLYYPSKLRKWIAACAVYPNLHWDLTLQLGQLLDTDKIELVSMGNIAQLNRLPWFKEGQIPIEKRTELVSWLEQEHSETLGSIRTMLHEVLSQNPPPEDSAAYEDYRINSDLNEWLICTDRKRKRRLEQQIAQQLESGVEPDMTVIKQLRRPQTTLDFIVPAAWRKYIYKGGYKGLGLRDFNRDLLWVFPIWLFLIGFTWWIEPTFQQCEDIEVIYQYNKLVNLPSSGGSRSAHSIYTTRKALPESWKLMDSTVVITEDPETVQVVNNEYVTTASGPSISGESKIVFKEEQVEYTRDSIQLCNDSPVKQIAINQALALGAIAAGQYTLADSLNQATEAFIASQNLSSFDSLSNAFRNSIATAYWNKAVYYYQKTEDDILYGYESYQSNQELACSLFNKIDNQAGSLAEDRNRALRWCNQEVVADFGTSVDECCAPCSMQFVNNSRDAESYVWDFGDGNQSLDLTPNHTYVDPGQYTVSLIAFGLSGNRDTIRRNINILGTEEWDLSIPTEIQKTGESINLSVLARRGTAFWDFGDGGSARGLEVRHQYVEPGKYAGEVIFSDGCQEVSENFTVEVEGPSPIGMDPLEPLDQKDVEEVDAPNLGDSVDLRPIAAEQSSNDISTDGQAVRFRCMWRDDPATTMVIGWDQVTGTNPTLYYGTNDGGKDISKYTNSQKPDRIVEAKGMQNNFVRLRNLRPNTKYYFVIKAGSQVSLSFSFQTAPSRATQRLSIIAGGDSRNHRGARRNANMMVGKLKPHCVLFAGDMTADDSGNSWKEWFDDWQYTMGVSRQLIPIIPARGNHEASNQSIVDLFDVPSNEVYYGLNLGGDLLRIYTLNTLIPSGGSQKSWLEGDLRSSQQMKWRIAQYHHAIRPHTISKPEKDELLVNWAKLFHNYSVELAVETDAHVAKWTYPIRPSNGAGSDQGFIWDDQRGTVYVGEGTWGAPLRANNDDKQWTRASGTFNGFNWIFVDQDKIEVRRVMTDSAPETQPLQESNRFTTPSGLRLWRPASGSVVTIEARERDLQTDLETTALRPDSTGLVQVSFELPQPADVQAILINPQLKQLATVPFPGLSSGTHTKSLNVSKVPPGPYTILIMVNGVTIQQYSLNR